jgi:hypothetical protein
MAVIALKEIKQTSIILVAPLESQRQRPALSFFSHSTLGDRRQKGKSDKGRVMSAEGKSSAIVRIIQAYCLSPLGLSHLLLRTYYKVSPDEWVRARERARDYALAREREICRGHRALPSVIYTPLNQESSDFARGDPLQIPQSPSRNVAIHSPCKLKTAFYCFLVDLHHMEFSTGVISVRQHHMK